MAESKNPSDISGLSENDSLDISELASLNEDYSVDFIEQLQSQLSQKTSNNKASASPTINTDDTQLFEEKPAEPKQPMAFNTDLEDNFIKKYKAKLAKQKNAAAAAEVETPAPLPLSQKQEEIPVSDSASRLEIPSPQEVAEIPVQTTQSEVKMPEIPTPAISQETVLPPQNDAVIPDSNQSIETVSGGNIIEKPKNNAQEQYRNSLDYLDNNTKYSKYVIYIDPENKDFIDSLTVKERKNLINRIIREQDSIVVTKKNLSKMQAIITHAIVAIVTIALAVPFIYWVVNVSLENTINNYKTSQTMFQTLYKEKGKIQSSRIK